MGLIIILGLLIWGWAEMSAFIYIGSEIGGLLTLLGVFVTAIFGIALLKRQGLSVLSRIQADLAKGRAPVTSIADSISMVVGGALMLIPRLCHRWNRAFVVYTRDSHACWCLFAAMDGQKQTLYRLYQFWRRVFWQCCIRQSGIGCRWPPA